jgi:hypothetical protein
VGDDASPILAAVARKKERKRERVQFERKLQSTRSEAEEEDLIAKLSPSTFSIPLLPPPLPPPPSSTVRLQFVTFCILYRKWGWKEGSRTFFVLFFAFS